MTFLEEINIRFHSGDRKHRLWFRVINLCARFLCSSAFVPLYAYASMYMCSTSVNVIVVKIRYRISIITSIKTTWSCWYFCRFRCQRHNLSKSTCTIFSFKFQNICSACLPRAFLFRVLFVFRYT